MKIDINFDVKGFQLKNSTEIKKWILDVIRKEKRETGEINIFFVTKSKIIEINKKFLDHDYTTDVITFSNNFLDRVNGEIYICVDVVRENAKLYTEGNFKEEIIRIIIHGVLHLLGYMDNEEEEKKMMREKENELIRYMKG